MQGTIRFVMFLFVSLVVVAGCGGRKTDPQRFQELLEKLANREQDSIDCRDLPKVGDSELKLLSASPGFEALHQLILDGTQVTDAGIRDLPAMPHLTFFSASKTRITDESLPLLARGGNLETLRLDETRISDRGLESIGTMRTLKSLSLWRCPITDEGLVHLKSLQKLTSLSLDETSVTGPAVVQNLTPLTGLRSLSIWKTKVSPTESAELKKQIPELKVNQ